MRTRYYKRRREHKEAELSITAFMNLMVILVPFLLITAVFSKISILELQLPSQSQTQAKTKKLQLEIVVTDDYLRVQDRRRGAMKTLRNTKEGYDTVALNEYLQAVKNKYQDTLDATILLQPDISYDVLVQVMDAVRLFEVPQEDGTMLRAELFPDISVGDAPVYTAAR